MVRVGPGWHRAAGGWAGLTVPPGAMIRRRVLPPSVPVHHYRQTARTPISSGTAQATISGAGAAVCQVGPAGFGVKWYPTAAQVGTTTGANDVSTVTLYNGVISAAALIGGQSYAGGGDTIGLAGAMLQPGEFLIAVWAGGHAGDIATLRIVGDQESVI